MTKYFDRFPVVDYNGTPAKNILTKVDFAQQTKRDIYSQFDFTVDDSLSRPDMLSYVYYDSPMYDWVVFLSNEVVDPYHDIYLREDLLQAALVKKYGSLSAARNTILFYRNNWAPDESTLDVSLYESLDISVKKYYRPILNTNLQVVGYERLKEDWIRSTNVVVSLLVDDVSGIEVGDIVQQSSSEASATVTSVDTENQTLTVQHVTGEFVEGAATGFTVLGTTIVARSIPLSEASFWKAVTAYDYAYEVNEQKKHITLIKKSYLPDIERLFADRMR